MAVTIGKKSKGNTGSINLNKEAQIKEPIEEVIKKPVVEEQPILVEESVTEPEPKIVEPEIRLSEEQDVVTEGNHEESDDGKKKRRRGKKSKKEPKKRRVKKDKNKEQGPLSIDEEYKKFRTRKIIVFASLIIITVALLFFGIYNSFLKHELTPVESAIYTNSYNNQGRYTQQYDTAVQGFLFVNAPKLLEKNFEGSDKVKYEFDNLSVERNISLDDNTILSFFSLDVIANGQTERIFCTIPLEVSNENNNNIKIAGELEISVRKAYSDYDDENGKVKEAEITPMLDFGEDNELVNKEDLEKATSFIDNFLTLAYNEKKDYSTIYTGDLDLSFTGEYLGTNKVEYYQASNPLGFNTLVEYRLRLSNGFICTNKMYMNLTKNESNTYVILGVL